MRGVSLGSAALGGLFVKWSKHVVLSNKTRTESTMETGQKSALFEEGMLTHDLLLD